MSRNLDNLLAFKILRMMMQPFRETEAFRLGIIDKDGNVLKRVVDFKTAAEKNAYTYLDRLVFSIKKIVNNMSGGENKLKSVAAALYLMKECYKSNDRRYSLLEERYKTLLEKLEVNNITLVEEEMEIKSFITWLKEEAPVNSTGAAVSTDQPKIDKKNIKKYQVINRRDIPADTSSKK